jgi:hypothetical protein
MEIRARLADGDVAGAAGRLEGLIKSAPDSPATIRSARRLAAHLETVEPARAARYYKMCLDATGTEAPSPVEVRSVADGLYRVARAVSRFDEKTVSVLDLRERPLPDSGVWKDAARAQTQLLSVLAADAKDRSAIEARLAWCLGLSGDWAGSKSHAEALIKKYGLLNANGINGPVLQKERWLAGVYLDYGHSLLQLGKAGQKFQFANAMAVVSNMVDVTAKGSEPWWMSQSLYFRILYERGEGNDLKVADAALSLLQGNYPDFDENRHGMKTLMTELRDKIKHR